MITLSERAAVKVRELLAEETDAETLRVAVQGGGCSGFQYALGFDGAPAVRATRSSSSTASR